MRRRLVAVGLVLTGALVLAGALVAFSLSGTRSPPRATATKGPQHLRLHPQNPHYFLFRRKPIALIGSGVYGAVIHRDFDYLVYLNELRQLGLNQTRLFTGSYVSRTSYGGPEYPDSLVPGDRLIVPWARSDTPGYPLGGNKFDLERWDPEYFERLRSFVVEAGRRGIVVEVVLFSANYGEGNWSASPLYGDNNVNGVGRVASYDAFRLDGDPGLLPAQEQLVEKIVRELSPFDNVYYEPLNEPYHASCAPPLETCPGPWQWEDRMIELIDRTERSLGRRHLIARGVGNVGFGVPNVHPAVSVLNFHYARPRAVRENYRLQRAIAHDETGFRGLSDDPYRIEAWEFMLSGGSVFSNLDWSFTPTSENGRHPLPADFHPGGGGRVIRRQLGFLKRFLHSFGLAQLSPARSMIRHGIPSGATVYALGRRGREYAIYVSGGEGVARLRLRLPPGRYRLQWHDPKTGRLTKRASLRHSGGEATAVSPQYSKDLALAVRSVKG